MILRFTPPNINTSTKVFFELGINITDFPTKNFPPFFCNIFSRISQKAGTLLCTKSLATVSCSSGELGNRALAMSEKQRGMFNDGNPIEYASSSKQLSAISPNN